MSTTPVQETLPQTLPPPVRFMQLVSGYWLTQAIGTAANLGVADHLTAGPADAETLAPKVGAHAPSLYRLLRALASVGLFTEDFNRRFALTPLGDCLRSDSPQSMRWMAVMSASPAHYGAWGDFLQTVKTGESAFQKAHGTDLFSYFREHPEEAKTFNHAMEEISRLFHWPTLAAYDMSGIRSVLDIGGGTGTLLAALAKANPTLTGAVYEAPQVAEGARRHFEAEGLADRLKAIPGDFTQSVPEGYDLYFLSMIIHGMDDAGAQAVLKAIHRAAPPQGKLLLLEMTVPPGSDPAPGRLMDLNMMALPGGKERTEAEFKELFASAGWRLTRLIPGPTKEYLVEAVKA